MALYRTISMNFWTDSKVVDDFTPEDKYFYLYLISNPHTNLCGCYEISMKQVVTETGYSMDTVEKLLVRFEEYHGVIRYSRITKEILLLNWHKYQWTKSEKFRKPLRNEIQKVKNREFREFLTQIEKGDDTGYGTDTVSIPYSYGSDTPVTVTDTVTDTNTVINSDINNKTKDTTNLKQEDKTIESTKKEISSILLNTSILSVPRGDESQEKGKQSKYEAIIQAWNSLSSLGIKPIKGISREGTRINNLRARYSQYGEEAILEAIESIRQSDFLQGKNKNGWTITFDWFIKPSNFAKVYEGNYDNSSHAPVDEYTQRMIAMEKWGAQFEQQS